MKKPKHVVEINYVRTSYYLININIQQAVISCFHREFIKNQSLLLAD